MSAALPESIVVLRQELKSWEQSFTARHGRKPSRDDIKSDADIAEKYKLFNRSRRPPSDPAISKTPRKSEACFASDEQVLKERCVNVTRTPQKTLANTPRREVPLQEQQPIVPTPQHIRCALGPTPQKDGHVLGLFDPLPGSEITAEQSDAFAVLCTPSRLSATAPSDPRHSRTPSSSGKRYFLDAFAGTPLKRKREVDDIGTPGSTKKTFATPAFLRRDCSFEAKTRPGRKTGLVRSLSTIIAGLRKNEEERMDEEWEIMRDLEESHEKTQDNNDSSDSVQDNTNVQVEDSQAPDMPLGPDRPAAEDADSGSDVEPDAVRKPWKKKGLKRQTKRVKMKSVLHAPQKADDATSLENDRADESGHDPAEMDGKGEDVSTVKKVLRKVNEAAHMNFRRLKIKNKNSKASGRGRFGRR